MIRPNFIDIINLLSQQSFKQIFLVDKVEYELYFKSFYDLSNITERVNKININKAIEDGNYNDILLYHYYSIPQIIDKNEALNFIKIAADKGSINAMYKYACLLDNNKNNRKEIDKYLPMAADNDNIDEMFYYGIQYISEYKMQKFNEERIYYIKKAADLGHKKAVYWYGYFLNEGKRIKVNI